MATEAPKSIVASAVVTTWLTTGGNFLAFKGALTTFPPVLLMGIRLLLAAALLALIALAGRKSLPRLSQVKSAVVAGLLLLVVGQGAVIWGVQDLPAGQTALFASSSPIFLAVISRLRGERLERRAMVGIGMGLVGLGLLTFAGRNDEAFRIAPVAIVLVGSAAWAFGSMYAARAEMPTDAIVSAAIQTISAGLIVFPIAMLRGETSGLSADSLSPVALGSVLYLGLIGLALGYSLFGWLDRATTPVVANAFNYVSPVIALFAGAVVLGEKLTMLHVAAAAILLSSVALMVNRKELRTSRGDET